MRATHLLLASAFGLALAGPSLAQEVGRYRLEPADGGFVRMDTQTGQMSFCTQSAAGLDCQPAGDERPAAGEIERLTRRIEALEQQVARLGAGVAKEALPSEEEFERTMGFMERFFRRFIGIVKDLEQEQGRGTPPPTPPTDRT